MRALNKIVTPFLNDFRFKIVFLFCLYLLSYSLSQAQELHFSQLSQTQLFTSPAFTGMAYGPRAFIHYRNQYPSIGTAVNSGYNTIYASYDQFVDEIHSGFGVQIIGDQLGDRIYSRYQIGLNYLYQARFNEYKALRIGLSAQAHIQQFDKSKLQFYDQIDPFRGFDAGIASQEAISDNFSSFSPNVHVGALYFTNSFYGGFAARNLLGRSYVNGTQGKLFEDMTISGQLGAVHWINEDNRTAIFPYLLADYQYQSHKVVANILYQYKLLNIGIGARHIKDGLESIILMTGMNFNQFRISYSYDIKTGSLSGSSGGAHELGLRFLLRGEDNSLYPNAHKNILFCPDFLRN